jgi:hypothetical protein
MGKVLGWKSLFSIAEKSPSVTARPWISHALEIRESPERNPGGRSPCRAVVPANPLITIS